MSERRSHSVSRQIRRVPLSYAQCSLNHLTVGNSCTL